MAGDQIGNVFVVPIDEKRVCYGHVVARFEPIYYMVAYDLTSDISRIPAIQEITNLPILFLGNFFDNLITLGRWKVIGHQPPSLSRIPFPAYKVQIGDQFFIENWNGTKRRPATPEEILLTDFRDSSGPIYLENALRAYFGTGSWDPGFNRLTWDYVLARSRVPWAGIELDTPSKD